MADSVPSMADRAAAAAASAPKPAKPVDRTAPAGSQPTVMTNILDWATNGDYSKLNSALKSGSGK